MKNVITATFAPGAEHAVAIGLWQWDYGQYMRIEGLDLPDVTEIHFEKGGESQTALGDTADGVCTVEIPDVLLETAGRITAYVYLHTGLHDGETEYQIRIPVRARARPQEYEGEEYDALVRATELLNNALDGIQDDVEAAQNARQGAEDAKTLAEGAKDQAVTAKNQAVSAASDAEAEKIAAQTARQGAETARGEAQSAKQAAQQAAADAGGYAQTAAAMVAYLASEHDATKTYQIGDLCTRGNVLYKCTTAIAAPEPWTAAHWTTATIDGIVSTLYQKVNGPLYPSSGQSL